MISGGLPVLTGPFPIVITVGHLYTRCYACFNKQLGQVNSKKIVYILYFEVTYYNVALCIFLVCLHRRSYVNVPFYACS